MSDAPAPGRAPSSLLQTVTIIGTGLIGTSVGLALTHAGMRVRLADDDHEALSTAVARGAGAELRDDDAAADLLLVAVPPRLTAAVLLEARSRGLAVTYSDVAGLKAEPLRQVTDVLGVDVADVVGGHPMAGRERSGPVAARRELFAGRPWLVTPLPGSGEAHVSRVRALAEACGAVPVEITPSRHDAAIALVSHVPHLMSVLTAARLADAAADAVAVAGTGVHDVTRLAASDAPLWIELLSGNAPAVAAVLRDVRADLDAAIAALGVLAGAPDDRGAVAALNSLLHAGATGRGRLPGKHGGAPVAATTVAVLLADREGELARLFADIQAAGVNVEDVRIDHAPGRPSGLVELDVVPSAAAELRHRLVSLGWTVDA